MPIVWLSQISNKTDLPPLNRSSLMLCEKTDLKRRKPCRKNVYRPEDIIAKLREADILISQGKTVAATIKHLGVSDVTYYRWRKEYGGMTTTQVKRLKELEKENQRLCRAVSDLTLNKLILTRTWPRAGLQLSEVISSCFVE